MITPDMIEFAGAALRLNLDPGVLLPLRDVEASLCEDGRSVCLLAPDDRGHWVGVSFQLSEPVAEGDFDPSLYSHAFE